MKQKTIVSREDNCMGTSNKACKAIQMEDQETEQTNYTIQDIK